MKQTDKLALQSWEDIVLNMNRASPVRQGETPKQKRARIKRLEADPEAWFMEYFADYCTAEPAPFHKKSTKRVLRNSEWFEVRAWSRELSKTGRTMMEMLYLTLTGKKKNVIIASNSYDNAERLLAPYKVILERNERIISDYGTQQKHGSWSDGEFITRGGVAFRALGAGQSPRGTRNDAIRPDVIILDDFDTDEDCRNPETVAKKWDWWERALYPTRSVSNDLLVVFNGNIIADDCCIKRAIKICDHHEVINIRDKNGKSTWLAKNSEEHIDRVLSKISYAAAQGEYFNNPITVGKIFKSLNYKKMRPIREYKFLVAYTDPSYKAGKKNDYKASPLVGKWRDEYHVIEMKCAQTTTAEMLDWHYDIQKRYGSIIPIYHYIEYPPIDDGLKREIKAGNKRHKITLPLKADPRKKPEKFHRIESKLEPLNRNEKLWFNENLKDSKHMQDTESQFLALSPTSRAHDDAPDAVEGAVYVVDEKTTNNVSEIEVMPFPKYNSKRL